MKTPHAFLLIAFLFAMLQNTNSVFAQKGFDAKKKKNISVSTATLNPVRIRSAAAKNSGARISTPPSLHKPFIQQNKAKVFYSGETGLPSFINTPRDNSAGRGGVLTNIPAACNDYLQELKPLLQIKREDVNFSIRQTKTGSDNNTRIRLDQHYKNIPVYGAEVVIHLNANGEGESFNGSYFNIEDNIDIVPVVSELSAVGKVHTQLAAKTQVRTLSDFERKLVQYEQPKSTLCIYQDKSLIRKFVLAYHIVTTPSLHQRWEYFIDAITGKVLHRFEAICFIDGPKTATAADLNGVTQTINTYQKGTTYFVIDTSRPMFNVATSVLPDEPVGGIMTIDMNSTFGDNTSIKHLTSPDNVWNSTNFKKAVSAHYNAGIAYDYFNSIYARNSMDGGGGTIISIINVTDETGQLLDNAFWNGKAMFYGNGNVGFKPLAGSLDVAGHEMTHGVVENTANLEYEGESGAINESMADIFGSMMDPADWLIGEDVVKVAAFPSGALRSLSDPHNGGTSLADPGFQPRHTNEKYNGTEDNGGVHINSGIPNNAFYRYAEAITRDKAAAVFYKALDDYLTKSSRFIDLRLAVIKAAGDLFGASSTEVTQAGVAFDAVGIGAGQGGVYTENLPGNPGTEFFLIYNTDASDANTLYRTNLTGSTAEALSQTDFISRPSITDDGSIAVFVGSDNKIHALNTAPGTEPEEFILQNEAIWSNVVVSKGGTKLAAVTNAQDATIYVYDFSTELWAEFELYNPTYSEGVNSGGPVYADALEWDYDGQILVYDCFNRIANSEGEDIEYWDVNFIQVWDNEANDFSDGTISKLFSSLPDGISIGNPSFSKISPHIIAFDYFDIAADEYAVLGCNIETNEVNVISANTTLGWPSYNKADSRIAFTSLDGTQYTTNYIVLNSDKISSSTSAVGLFSDAKWPVYFSAGEREIGDQLVTGISEYKQEKMSLTCYPTNFTDKVVVVLDQQMISGSNVELINTMAQKVYAYRVSPSGDPSILLDLENIPPGYYFLRVTNSHKRGACRIVKK
ncbi:MAG: M4 family metallopeptidase [Cyclobacteriaceae bacterium]